MVAARWPRGPLPWLAIIGMAAGISAAFFPSTRPWPVVKQAFALGTFIFRSPFGLQVVMGAASVAHLVESAFTLHICTRNKVSTQDTLGWVGLTLLMGYLAIDELKRRLKQAS